MHQAYLEAGDLGEALERLDAEGGDDEELVDKGLDEGGLEDEAKGDPGEEALERLERGLDERGPLGAREDEVAELEDLAELLVKRLLHGADLCRRHLVLGEVEHLCVVAVGVVGWGWA